MKRITVFILVWVAAAFVFPVCNSYASQNEWNKVGVGTVYFADFPSGYNTDSALYNKYNGKRIDPYENSTNKREVVTYQVSWIYWHWTFNNIALPNDNYNVFIEDHYGWDPQINKTHQFFSEFESPENYSEYDPNGRHDDIPGRCYCCWRGIPSEGSWWWFRIPIYKQEYTDYVKATPESTTKPVSPTVKQTDLKKSLSKITVSNCTYTGGAVKPKVTLICGGKKLKEGTDYKVSYKNNKKIGTATIIITGRGKYTGTIRRTFRINPKGTTLRTCKGGKKQIKIGWNKQSQNCSGYQIRYSTRKDFKGSKVITIKGQKTANYTLKNLKAGTRYYIQVRVYYRIGKTNYCSAWSKCIPAVTIKAAKITTGNSPRTKNKNQRPLSTSLSNIKISNCTYSGGGTSTKVTLMCGGKKLKEGTDYTVTYRNNKKVGTATIIITGCGKYTGTIERTFKINPKGTSLKKYSSGQKQIVVRWAKQGTGCSGYQIRYSTNKNLKNCKIITVKGSKNTSCTLKNLKVGTRYYIQVRVYCNVGKTKYYSGWSKCSSYKTKPFSTATGYQYEIIKYNNRVYCGVGNKLKVVDLKTRKVKTLATTASNHIAVYDMCIKNGYLYYCAYDDEGFDSALYRIRLNGKNNKRLHAVHGEDRFFGYRMKNNKLYLMGELADKDKFVRYVMNLDGSKKKVDAYLNWGKLFEDYEKYHRVCNAKGYRTEETYEKEKSDNKCTVWLITPSKHKIKIGLAPII